MELLVWTFWRFFLGVVSSLFSSGAIACGCTVELKTRLGSTRKQSMTPWWKGGWPRSLGTRIIPVDLGGFLHSTITAYQTRYVCSTFHCILVMIISVCSANWPIDLC